MTENVDNVDNVQELAGFAVDKLDTYFKLVEETISKYGGDAVDLGLNVLRIEAVSTLIKPILLFIIAFILFKYCYRKCSTVNKVTRGHIAKIITKGFGGRSSTEDSIMGELFNDRHIRDVPENIDSVIDRYNNTQPTGIFRECVAGYWLTGLASLVVMIISLLLTFNIWSWVGIFYPELYAVHKLILT